MAGEPLIQEQWPDSSSGSLLPFSMKLQAQEACDLPFKLLVMMSCQKMCQFMTRMASFPTSGISFVTLPDHYE